MLQRRAHRLARPRVPHSRRLVLGRRHDARPVRTEGRRVDEVSMPQRRSRTLSRLRRGVIDGDTAALPACLAYEVYFHGKRIEASAEANHCVSSGRHSESGSLHPSPWLYGFGYWPRGLFSRPPTSLCGGGGFTTLVVVPPLPIGPPVWLPPDGLTVSSALLAMAHSILALRPGDDRLRHSQHSLFLGPAESVGQERKCGGIADVTVDADQHADVHGMRHQHALDGVSVALDSPEGVRAVVRRERV